MYEKCQNDQECPGGQCVYGDFGGVEYHYCQCNLTEPEATCIEKTKICHFEQFGLNLTHGNTYSAVKIKCEKGCLRAYRVYGGWKPWQRHEQGKPVYPNFPAAVKMALAEFDDGITPRPRDLRKEIDC